MLRAFTLGKLSGLMSLSLTLLAFVTGCSSAASESTFQGGPRLSAEPGAVDFGTVAEGTEVKASFTLTNVGDSPLHIEKAVTRVVEGCCPPTPQLSTQHLEPGKKAALILEFAMVGDMVGPHRFEVLVYSNDAVSTVATLEVRGTYLSR